MDHGQQTLCELLLSSRSCIALTGAGISADSGIPTFRGMQGLWEKYDIMEYAHIDAFNRDPVKVWKMLAELDDTICRARPNPAHRALAELERLNLLQMVITQNVDNLHQEAGNTQVVEFHGNAGHFVCLDCRRSHQRPMLNTCQMPPRCECGGLIKPDVIFIGEAIPWLASMKAFSAVKNCDLILVIGTSAMMAPASELPAMAKQNGAKIVEINIEKTHLTTWITDLLLEGPASEVLPPIVDRVRKMRAATA